MMHDSLPSRRGPKKKYGPRDEVHLKFSPDMIAFIEQNAPQGKQAFFDELLKQQMLQAQLEPDMRPYLWSLITQLQKTLDTPPESYEDIHFQRLKADLALHSALSEVMDLLPDSLQAHIKSLQRIRELIWERKEPVPQEAQEQA